MARKSSIIPTDISSSREYYGLNNSQDIYKGTSFKFSGAWTENTHYFNDEYIIDFVTHPYINENNDEVMAMWACTRNHLSVIGSEPMFNSRYWTFVMSGATGSPGQVYVPSLDKDGNLIFILNDRPSSSLINVKDFKGERGDPGKSPKLTVWLDDNSDIRDDQIRWGYDGEPISEWSTLCYLDDLRGDSITGVDINDDGKLEITTAYKRKTESGEFLIETSKYTTENTVLPEFRTGYVTTVGPDDKANVSIVKTSNPKEWEINYAIPSGRNATIDISRTITLDPDTPAAVINEGTLNNAQLRFEIPQGKKGDPGDQNIYIGCDEPEDKDQIWYDPCDTSAGGIDSLGVVYDAYIKAGGNLNESEFTQTFRDLSKLGFEVKWAATFEDLGEATEDKLGYLWVVNSGVSSNDMYEEWVVVNTAATGTPMYKWERWGSGTISTDVNLDNYYTKDQVDQHITNAVNQFSASFNGGEVDASSWE